MSHYPQGASKPAANHFGRTFFIGGSFVAAGLVGFYLNMLRMKNKQVAAGRNPLYEQVVASVSRKPLPGEELQVITAVYSDHPPAFPATEHHSGHTTTKNWKDSKDYAETGRSIRYMVPPPQRARSDDPSKAYTKSPDYVKNYNKTTRPVPTKAQERLVAVTEAN